MARVDSIANSNAWAKAGVMIRESLEAGSTHAFVAVTPGNGISFQRRPESNTTSYNTDAAGLVAPYWVKLTRSGSTFTAQRSEDGATWVDITPASPVTIAMGTDVYVGLAVTSHDAAISTVAEISSISTTGTVTGAWQVAGIGATQPEGNTPEPLYVTVEDSAGKTATVRHPDAAVTARPEWHAWQIPRDDFGGVNLARVETMSIGVGNPDNPAAGGTGLIYIDDILFGHPSQAE